MRITSVISHCYGGGGGGGFEEDIWTRLGLIWTTYACMANMEISLSNHCYAVKKECVTKSFKLKESQLIIVVEVGLE